MSTTACHSLQHHLEHELWLKELSYLNDEINILKRHLSDIYYRDNSEEEKQLVAHFSESFKMQKEWLHKMKEELEHYVEFTNVDHGNELRTPSTRSFRLQMQANRMVNQELKDNFLKLFS
ncbi:MAG TPA: hypothetical protein VF145_04410 [Chitinophagaceae bacterium]